MKKSASSEDVARAAGVSRATVSYVLNKRMDQSIPEETRHRVIRAAEALSYRPNRLARGLQRGKTHTLGVMMPSLSQSFHAGIMQGIREVCFEQDYRILLAQPEHEAADGTHIVNLLLEHQVDGLLCVAAESPLDQDQMRRVLFTGLEQALATGLACVVVDDRSLTGKVDCIVTDDTQGARRAVEYLLERGHRRIGHLSGGQALTTARDRTQGYREALEAAGIEPDPLLTAGTSYHEDEAVAATSTILDGIDPPTAIFAANDYLAAWAWRTAQARGLRVPEDLALVGYGDVELARFLGLTTMQQHPREIGRVATERLLARLKQPDMPPESLIQPTDLVRRTSAD
jgi:LacI family transcriptional regulator